MTRSAARHVFTFALLASMFLATARASAGDWKPTESQLDRLDGEANFERFAIRPPAGARASHPAGKGGQEDRHVWTLEQDGGPIGGNSVSFLRRPATTRPRMEEGIGPTSIA